MVVLSSITLIDFHPFLKTMPEQEYPDPVFERIYLALPPGYNGRAIKNHTEHQRGAGKNPITMQDAIDLGFTWRLTPEGSDFWSAVYEASRIPNWDKLPPLPES
jgi:hypothetical protein